MSCEHCNGPGKPDNNRSCSQHVNSKGKCCWAVAFEIHQFKKRVFRLYIAEALFDMLVSVASVVVDIVTLIHYFTKGKWVFAVLTGLPILLPTIVFANVYLSDETRRSKKREPSEVIDAGVINEEEGERKEEVKMEGGRFLDRIEEITVTNKFGVYNFFGCCGGLLHSLFHKNRHIRRRGARLARKSMGRSVKYLFGTLLLRFIAWTWYLKALMFGYKALKEPKKYMKIEPPEAHWSRELLIRLDFFQAALENAPQCVIQLYALLTDAKEDPALGILALTFSFIDFVRVTTTVLWNVNKGPVIAPENCYGTLIWQLMNICSWTFLYVARCAAMSLIIGTAFSAVGITLLIPIFFAVLHCGVFAYFLNKLSLGQASEKLLITTFISIFFLPDLDIRGDIHAMIQLYYGLTLVENTLFIIPWGWDLSFTGFCYSKKLADRNTTTPSSLDPSEFASNMMIGIGKTSYDLLTVSKAPTESDCLIDPVVVVLMVPTLTIVGIVFRLAAAKKMNHFKGKQLQESGSSGKSFTMEDRVSRIYGKRWTKMTATQMWTAFMKMLRKEVTPLSNPENKLEEEGIESGLVTNGFQAQFRDTQNIIRNSFSVVWKSSLDNDDEQMTRKDHENDLETGMEKRELEKEERKKNMDIFHGTISRPDQVRRIIGPEYFSNDPQLYQNLDFRFLKVETGEGGVHVFETIHI